MNTLIELGQLAAYLGIYLIGVGAFCLAALKVYWDCK